MRRFPCLPLTAAAAVFAIGLAAAPAPAQAQTPPPPPAAGDGAGTGDLPPPVAPDNDGPPPVVRGETPPPPPPAVTYYAVLDGNQAGPFDEQALIAMISEGRLTGGTQVWKSGMAGWETAQNVPELAALIERHAQAGPPPAPPAAGYYVMENGAQAGPFTLPQLTARVTAGTLSGDTLVWKQGMAQWQAAADVPELAALIRTAPPPAARDAAPFMIGRWEMDPIQVPVEGAGPGTLTGQAEYGADGQFSTTLMLNFTQNGFRFRRVITTNGTFTATFKSDDVITAIVKGQASGQLQSLDNGKSSPPALETVNSSFDIKIVDRATVTDQTGNERWRRIAQ